ncbi:helix-turn-helix transcriptional regulator [Frigidibacter sp. ROC022]|uniref:helix-turn-helix transcriptional regulator n=1 Tax=Frigidibacter sp. ROC022 TaxID=2971796 RepID=UPI00215AEE79|nr:LuxR family transcriptional regulator [Frigidibacter sp. ROC022]
MNAKPESSDSSAVVSNYPEGVVTATPQAAIETVTKIANCTKIEDAWALGVDALRQFGFDQINYGFTRFRHANAIGDPADALFLTNHDAAHVKAYFESGFFSRTPMFRWVSENVGACSWRWAHEQRAAGNLTESELRAMDENWKLGVRAGYSIGFAPTSARSKGAMGLTARAGLDQDQVDAIWDRHGDQVLAVANLMHLKLTQLPYPVQRRPLTERQREALEWVADGKTTQDIAMLMEISTAMVEKHLRLARDALSVETTAHAVAKASFLNQIFVIDPETGLEKPDP